MPSKGICFITLSMCLVLACSDSRTPTAPEAAPDANRAAAPAKPEATGRSILMLDECEPDSFNEAVGEGTCINRNGGLTFDKFVALFNRMGQVPSWKFAPGAIHVSRTEALPIVNGGGETHTFTEVEEFGGGVVPFLNGGVATRPECLALAPSDFIPSGGRTTHTFEAGEVAKYQCCIHPWMRAETH